MRLKSSLFSAKLMLTSMLLAVSMQVLAQAPDPTNRRQMRELAYNYCSRTASASVCNCFADALSSNFNEKDWRIFIADTDGRSAPPSGVGESDLDSYGRKLSAAGNTCGMQ